jgi:dienelactone hydrolase
MGSDENSSLSASLQKMKFALTRLAVRYSNRPLATVSLLCLFLPALSATAQTIEVKLPSGITAMAGYHKGTTSLPTVLLLHGFLQTHQSQPMNSLASNLASRGYSVLSPTISLGINRRSQSMACEAVHTHTISDDTAEIAHWVSWLGKKGHKNIVLVGFSSTGNSQILQYISQGTHPEIKKTILTSFVPMFINLEERQKARRALATKRQAGAVKIAKYSLGYCKQNFASTPESYLSYASFDPEKIFGILKQSQVSTDIILGAEDFILPAPWLSQLKALKEHIVTIPGANHFFEGTAEFDLAEEVEAVLKNLPYHSS